MQNRQCFYSSFIFLSNILLSYKYKKYNYTLYFIILFLTSVFFHYKNTEFTYILDQLILFKLFYESVITFYNIFDRTKTYKNSIIFFSYFYVFYFYYIGYYYKKYCFHKNNKIANQWHSSLHIISSIGFNVSFIY
jgi:hypothetical protein